MSTEKIPGELIDKVVKIRRCAAVVKGGRRFSFAALVIVGLMAAALVAAAGSAVASAALDIDPSAGAVTRSFGEPVAVGYDSQWTGSGWSGSDSATVVVYAEPKAGACVGHGTVYLIGSSSSPVKGRGQLKWTPPYSGTWTLHHKVTDGGGVVFDYAIVVTVTPGGGSYTVRFHYNVAASSPTKDQTFQVGETKSLLWKDSQLGWSRAGYEFLGWATASASGFAKYVNGQSVKDLAAAGQTVHLYAVWYGGASYRVMYHRNYTSSDTTTASHRFWNGDSSQLAWKDSQIGWANPSGKTFLGWAETAGATKAKWANGATVSKLTTQGKTIHLYAVWSAKKAAAAVAMAGTGTQGTSGAADAGLGAGTYAALALVDGVPVPITVYVYADGLAWAAFDGEIFVGLVGEDGAGEFLGAGGAIEVVLE